MIRDLSARLHDLAGGAMCIGGKVLTGDALMKAIDQMPYADKLLLLEDFMILNAIEEIQPKS